MVGRKNIVCSVAQKPQGLDTWKGYCFGLVGVRCHGGDLDLTFYLTVVALTFKISGYISVTVRCRKLILGGDSQGYNVVV